MKTLPTPKEYVRKKFPTAECVSGGPGARYGIYYHQDLDAPFASAPEQDEAWRMAAVRHGYVEQLHAPGDPSEWSEPLTQHTICECGATLAREWTKCGVCCRSRTGESPKEAAGAAKTPLHLLPPVAMAASARVHALGAVKYGQWNWRTSSVKMTTYIAAARRHLDAILDGEDTDPESGESHWAHVSACCNIMLDAAEFGTLVDDRPPKLPAMVRDASSAPPDI